MQPKIFGLNLDQFQRLTAGQPIQIEPDQIGLSRLHLPLTGPRHEPVQPEIKRRAARVSYD